MTESNPANVYAAFETLLEEIEAGIDTVNQSGAQAFAERDYDRARAMLDRVDHFTGFRDKVVALRAEWQSLIGVSQSQVAAIVQADNASQVAQSDNNSATPAPELEADAEIEPDDKPARMSYGRLQRGLRTPEVAYYQPILQALDEQGGRARINDLLDRVEQIMHGRLSEVDYQPLNSDPDVPRWRNAAQWARNQMVKEGLLRDYSPRGVWEISDAGREALMSR